MSSFAARSVAAGCQVSDSLLTEIRHSRVHQSASHLTSFVGKELGGFAFSAVAVSENFLKISQNLSPAGCHVTFCGAADADGHQFRRSGYQAVNQASAGHEFENRYAQCDAMPGFYFNEERTGAVALHRDARFGGDGGEDALEDAVILGGAESDEWLGSYLFQGDRFEPSERMRSGQRHAPRVGAQQFKLDAHCLLAGELDHDGEFKLGVVQSGDEFIA